MHFFSFYHTFLKISAQNWKKYRRLRGESIRNHLLISDLLFDKNYHTLRDAQIALLYTPAAEWLCTPAACLTSCVSGLKYRLQVRTQ